MQAEPLVHLLVQVAAEFRGVALGGDPAHAEYADAVGHPDHAAHVVIISMIPMFANVKRSIQTKTSSAIFGDSPMLGSSTGPRRRDG